MTIETNYAIKIKKSIIFKKMTSVSNAGNLASLQRVSRHQEFRFPLGYAAHLGTETEHQVLNGSHIFVSFTRMVLLCGTKSNIRVK